MLISISFRPVGRFRRPPSNDDSVRAMSVRLPSEFVQTVAYTIWVPWGAGDSGGRMDGKPWTNEGWTYSEGAGYNNDGGNCQGVQLSCMMPPATVQSHRVASHLVAAYLQGPRQEF